MRRLNAKLFSTAIVIPLLALMACSSDGNSGGGGGTGGSSQTNCLSQGTVCNGTSTCCLGNSCANGTCQACNTVLGQACSDTSTCCSAVGIICALPSNTCLLQLGNSCTRGADCIGGNCQNGICCLAAGNTTSRELDCCSGQVQDIYLGTGADRYYAYSQCL